MDTSRGTDCQALVDPGVRARETTSDGTCSRQPGSLRFSMKRLVLACLSATLLASAGSASAHSLLTVPPPLTGDDNAKAGPCGCYFGAGPEDPAEDASPLPCPTDYPVTTLEAGTELTVEWKETINHAGQFRIAFSPKSPDQTLKADVDANILSEIPDENGTSGATITQTVTVPSEPCELCVLQLRQFMMNAAQPYYYSCAAVKIVAPAASTSSGAGGGGTGGTDGSGGAGLGGGPGATGPSTNAVSSSGAGYAEPQPKVAEGCSATPRGQANAGALALVGLALALSMARRRR